MQSRSGKATSGRILSADRNRSPRGDLQTNWAIKEFGAAVEIAATLAVSRTGAAYRAYQQTR